MQISLLLLSSSLHASVTALHAITVYYCFPRHFTKELSFKSGIKQQKNAVGVSALRHRDDSIITNPVVTIRPLGLPIMSPFLLHSLADPSSRLQPCWSEREHSETG